jgi:bacillithiol system protein YtxJ
MNWISFNDQQQLQNIKSANGYSIIFKHSTRCSISMMAKKKFELDWDVLPENMSLYFLDLLSHRDISNAITDVFQVHHQSPQLLLIKDGECIFESSHGEISAEEVVEQINS